MTTTLEPTTRVPGPPAPARSQQPSPPSGARSRQPERAVTASGVLRSEWVKLRSVRSSTMTLLASAGTLLFIGAAAAALNGGLLTASLDEGGAAVEDPTATVLGGILLVPLIIGILGVMSITSEYATGTIRPTMTFVPGRLPVLWSKVAVLIAVTLPVMVASTLTTFLVGQWLLGAGDLDVATATLGDPGVLRAVLGTAAYLTGIAVIGLALGTLLRGTAAAISALFALVFLVPVLGSFLLPASIRDDVLLYLPSNAGTSFTSVVPTPDLLSSGAGGVVFAAWVVVPVLAAAVALRRRPV